MAKRFTDTGLNRQPWFRKLKPKYKCAIRFIFDECDVAGVWIEDMETLSYFIGEKVSKDDLFKQVNSDKENRIEMLGRDKIFIPGFVSFQYGSLSENCKPHKPIIEKLKKYGLLERVLKGYSKGIDTLEEKETDMDKEKEQEMEKEKARLEAEKKEADRKAAEEAKKFKPPTLVEFESYFTENGFSKDLAQRVWKGYADASPPWTDSEGKQVKNWKGKCQHVWFKDSNKKQNERNNTINRPGFGSTAIAQPSKDYSSRF